MTYADRFPYRRPFHPGLVGSGATLLIAAFASDLFYWKSLLFQWNNFSQWLIAAGLVLAFFAAIALVVDLASGRIAGLQWMRLIAMAIVVVVGVFDAFVHSRDAYTAVVPEGLFLSGVAAVILLIVGLTGGWSLDSRRTIARSDLTDIRS